MAREIYIVQFNDDVMKAASDASKLKQAWFKAVSTHEDVDKNVVLKYLGSLNGFLQKYTEYGEEVKDAAKSSKADNIPGSALTYNDVKDYLYAKYDYAGILKFTDSIYKAINRNEFKDNDDVESFFEDQVNKFFKSQPASTAAVSDEVISVKPVAVDKREVSMFNSVKSQKLFDTTERKEIYDAIRMTIDYVSNQINQKGKVDLMINSMNAQIIFINNVVEFMTYTLVVYMSRIFIICRYLNNYIRANEDMIDAPVEESVQNVSDKISESEVDIIKSADEASLREPKDLTNFCGVLKSFVEVIGGNTHFNDRGYVNNSNLEKNIFDEAALSNPLYEFIINKINTLWFEGSRGQKELNDILDEFKGYMNNGTQALSTTISAKQELIPVIKLVGDDKKTKEGIQEVASDLADFSVNMLERLSNAFARWVDSRTFESRDPNHNLHMLNGLAELVKLTKDLYEEIASATLARFRDLEILYNGTKNDELKKVMDGFKVKVPGDMKDTASDTNTVENIVPDTSRLPVDLYALPQYEAYQMYSEYARTIFPNDTYYSEAFDFSKLIDTLIANISGFFKKVNQFFDNDKFKNAVQWVTSNETKLRGMNFNTPMSVLPYKADIKYPSITDFNQVLNTFNADNIKTQDDLDKFIDSLYNVNQNDQTFTTILKSNDKGATKKLENYVLFGLDQDTPVTEKELSTPEAIKNEMTNVWIDTVKASNNLRQSFINAEQQSKNTIQSIKTKIAGATMDKPEEKIDNAPDITGGNEEASSNPMQTNNSNELLKSAVTRIETAYSKIVFPTYNIFRKAIVDQYNYIKQAFQNGEK